MRERLQKIISQAGICSRRNAENLITSGRITVNGDIVLELGTKADPEIDDIMLDGRPIKPATKSVYVLLYKPAGYVTTMNDPQGRPIVTKLVDNIPERLFPVGRLDYNTEGLLLLTNDGEWANRLAHPRHEVDKEYHVRVRGTVTKDQLQHLATGVSLNEGKTAPAGVSVLSNSPSNTWLSITIHEGRYRQIRRMCTEVGLTVVRLKRVRYGSLTLENLKPGQWRLLSHSEVTQISS